MENDDDGIRVVAGYQKPEVIQHLAKNEEVVLRLLKYPDIAGLTLDLFGIDTTTVGRAISNNDHLRTLKIHGGGGKFTGNKYQTFFMWLAHNRSIEYLDLSYTDLDFAVLAPFFEHNTNLRCIVMKNCCEGSETSSTLISVLSQTRMNRLARIDLCYCDIRDEQAADLFNALNEMPGLQNLLDLSLRGNMIADEGCLALCALLKNTDCRMITLDLSRNYLDDQCLGILTCGCFWCDTLESLSCGKQQQLFFTPAGWTMFSTYLSTRWCSLEKLIVRGCSIGDESAAILGNSLSVNKSCKYLDFAGNEIAQTGWQRIFKCLMAPSALMELDLSTCNINDEGAYNLFSVLAHNASLKKLILVAVEDISPTGWVACFQILMGSRSALEVLNFGCNDIDDEGALALVNLVASHMCTVLSLNVWKNHLITTNGCCSFADVLAPRSTSKLKVLRLGSINGEFDDGALVTFIAALANNDSLKELDVFGLGDFSLNLLDTLVNVLCDKTSIANVCNSNHSLNIFSPNYESVHDYPGAEPYKIEHNTLLGTLLDMNKNTDKGEVIRKKLITYFFSDVESIFGSMDTSIMPNVMEWIGRDRLGYSVMFAICRSVPTLLNK
jgi:Ran GTPase-activating protein (RanGAP) involved in mRNA processing and transport